MDENLDKVAPNPKFKYVSSKSGGILKAFHNYKSINKLIYIMIENKF